MYDDFKSIIVKVEDRVGTIMFNRPKVGNAIDTGTVQETIECIERMGQDDNIGCIVTTGVGRFYSAGGDIVGFKEKLDSGENATSYESVITVGLFGRAPKLCPKPVIAMVNGAAAGAGASFALGCDFRFMTPKSQIKMAFIGLGFPGDTGGAYFLERLVGAGKALEMMMLGEPMYGEEAARLNVARLVQEEEKLEEETYKFAKRLANGPLMGYKFQKKLFMEVFYNDIDKVNALEALGMSTCAKSQDLRIAVEAFLEKRQPKFTGK